MAITFPGPGTIRRGGPKRWEELLHQHERRLQVDRDLQAECADRIAVNRSGNPDAGGEDQDVEFLASFELSRGERLGLLGIAHVSGVAVNETAVTA
jgi:hypothetical protein